MSKSVAVIGAGWAGCAAAIEATRRGHRVTVFEASHHAGGRARRLEGMAHDSRLDNGQHILIGAYTETLALMQRIGVDVQACFQRSPLQLVAADGHGLQWPALSWPPALAAALAMLGNREWTPGQRLALLRTALAWKLRDFSCPPDWSVAHLCRNLPAIVMQDMIEPLCVSALNTPADRASACVLLRVLHDALFAVKGGSDLLVPALDLSALLPEPALQWLQDQGAVVHTGCRVLSLQTCGDGWRVGHGCADAHFDAAVLATPHRIAARLVQTTDLPDTGNWLARAARLQDEAIATVYARATAGREPARLPRAMLRLRGAPAQFAFDRGQLGNAAGTLALVISAPSVQGPDAKWPDKASLERAAIDQARQELRTLGITSLEPLRTVMEKQATFASTPGLRKPAIRVSPARPGLLACGDYVEGPYPATLEAAVRSGLAAASLV